MKQLFCLLIAINFSVAAQIKGVVKDEISGKPIPYVNIWIENQNIGTTAEENGEYSINSKEENINLIFSALGYEKKTINSSQSKEIKLQPIATELEEIIVQKKKKF